MLDFIRWMIGVFVSIGMIKFVFIVFRRLTSKESMDAFIDGASNKMYEARLKAEQRMKKRKEERRIKRENKNEPWVTIR